MTVKEVRRVRTEKPLPKILVSKVEVTPPLVVDVEDAPLPLPLVPHSPRLSGTMDFLTR